jgi:hypothetical protein
MISVIWVLLAAGFFSGFVFWMFSITEFRKIFKAIIIISCKPAVPITAKLLDKRREVM